MLTVLLLLWPVAAALLLHFFKGRASRVAAFGAALVELALAVFAAVTFNANNSGQFGYDLNWIPSAGIRFAVGMDGLSLLLVLLTALLVPLILLSAFRRKPA